MVWITPSLKDEARVGMAELQYAIESSALNRITALIGNTALNRRCYCALACSRLHASIVRTNVYGVGHALFEGPGRVELSFSI